MSQDWIGYSYAALVSAGGIMGYVKAGSVTSLVAGLFFGFLAGVGAYLMSQNPTDARLSLGEWVKLGLVINNMTCPTCRLDDVSECWKQLHCSNMSSQCVNRYLRNTGHCHGNEVSKFLEVHASWSDGNSEYTDAGEDCSGNVQETT